MIDFSKLGKQSQSSSIEPRDIFMALPEKSEYYEYPRDVQSEVWKQWFESRDNKNTIIKMNTGSGKTVVGLTILQSCLAEGKGPAVYVVPDTYLIKQVCNEAKKLGVKTTQDEDDYDFIMKRAILVINIHKLINGKSVFGMRRSNNVEIGSALIDDAHACIETIGSQFMVKIPSTNDAYNEIEELFDSTLKTYSEQKYQEIVKQHDPYSTMLIPFWSWQEKTQDVRNVLNKYREDDNIKFHLPLIDSYLSICNCIISASDIEITPKCIPINKIQSFEQAERRIFMSATLADDSVFVTSLGLKTTELSNIITPDKASDIGDRLLLFPQVINKKLSDVDIKTILKSLSQEYNVVVIVPSYKRKDFWEDETDLIMDYQTIYDGVAKLKSGHVGLAVLVNKYDGIDLPDEACRILVIDGLPNMRSEYNSFIQSVNPSSKELLREQIQKVEQGMGRGVRSNNDYCVAVLMGKGLSDIIIRANGKQYFSKATQKQFELSQQLWDQICEENQTPSLEEIFSLADYSLRKPRNKDWIKVSKDVLSSVSYDTQPHFDSISVAFRNAFEKASISQYSDAVKIIEKVKNATTDERTKGYLMQIMAEYINFINPAEAQQLLLSGIQYNLGILRPIQGIQCNKLINKTTSQAQAVVDYIVENHLDPNNYVIKINAILENIAFTQNTASHFEAAIKEIALALGFVSSRPEFERGKGPDNLWGIGNNKYLVIECKNGTITDTIKKHDCNQLNGSKIWFENEYKGNAFFCTPIMIHNSCVFDYACSPDPSTRIITPVLLDKFRNNVSKFVENITKVGTYKKVGITQQVLSQFNLLGDQIVDCYTTPYTIK